MQPAGAFGVSMKRTCPECGTEYTILPFRLDSGLCAACKPGFLAKPLWFMASEAGTRSVYQFALVIHLLYALFFPWLMDCGGLSYPALIYSLSVCIYFGCQFPIPGRSKYPILTRTQKIGILLLPLYGLVGFVVLFHWVQKLRYGL